MDEKAVLEIINGLRNQIAEVKGQMREQHRREIERIESAYENEKALLEQKCQEEIGEYKDIISLQKGELDRLKLENGQKEEKIVQIESSLIEKDEEIGRKSEELRTKTSEYNFLQTRFDEKVSKIQNLEQTNINKDQKIQQFGIDLNARDQTISSLTSSLNAKNSENSTLSNDLNIKCRAYSSLQNDLSIAKQENKRLNSSINDIRRENDNLNSQLCDKNREVRNLQSQLNDKTTENGRLKSCLDAYKERERREKEKEESTDLEILNSTMCTSMKNEAIETTRRSFDIHFSNYKRAEFIGNHFESKYGGKWTCIVGKIYYFTPSFWCENGRSIDFKLGNRHIILFKNFA